MACGSLEGHAGTRWLRDMQNAARPGGSNCRLLSGGSKLERVMRFELTTLTLAR